MNATPTAAVQQMSEPAAQAAVAVAATSLRLRKRPSARARSIQESCSGCMVTEPIRRGAGPPSVGLAPCAYSSSNTRW